MCSDAGGVCVPVLWQGDDDPSVKKFNMPEMHLDLGGGLCVRFVVINVNGSSVVFAMVVCNMFVDSNMKLLCVTLCVQIKFVSWEGGVPTGDMKRDCPDEGMWVAAGFNKLPTCSKCALLVGVRRLAGGCPLHIYVFVFMKYCYYEFLHISIVNFPYGSSLFDLSLFP
jgi:hypothetical protein